MSPLIHTTSRQPGDPWRSLEEHADSPEFRELLKHEFPSGAAWLDEMETGSTTLRRRRFMQLMGASFGLAGLASCGRQPRETIVPYVEQPENLLPGRPEFYASAVSFRGHARGVLVESNMGRPTKIEGNPDHPSSLGATDAPGQAAILDLYDPDRARTVKHRDDISTWSAFDAVHLQVRQADGYAILIEPTSSPTMQRLLAEMLEKFPAARIYQHSPWLPAAPGPKLDFSLPDLIVAIDDDFLADHPDSLRHTREFVSRRRSGAKPNRLYVIEPTPTLTGVMADHRLAVKPSRIPAIRRAIDGEAVGLDPREAQFVRMLRDDLSKFSGSTLFPGKQQGAPVPATLTNFPGLGQLTADLQRGAVRSLLILGGNPIYHANPKIGFAEALAKASFTAYLGSHEDETAVTCEWRLPEAHWLEAWGDIRAWDGTPGVRQPLIEPLYQGRPAISLLAGGDPRELVRKTWSPGGEPRGDGFETFWKTTLHDGVGKNIAFAPLAGIPLLTKVPEIEAPVAADIELVIRPDPNVGYGEGANNGWLQELPRPFTKLVWDNAAIVSPALAKRRGLASGDMVKLAAGVEAPVWILPGQADDTVTVHAGYGRRNAGTIGTGVGFDISPLLGGAPQISLAKTGARHELVTTQHHSVMEGRNLIWRVSADDIASGNLPNRPPKVPDITLYAKPSEMMKGRYAWAMSIDLSACTGCNACILACQAENNIPVVGKTEVSRGREMHWIRLDRYFIGDNPDDPKIVHQPVTCQQCEQAPCEVVCPVEATVHTADGINAMVYNRCVGTRYCSNNCPYKVRRFNFFDYRTKGLKADPRSLQKNPEVTVRGRGVMEKCNYCIQRIERAVIRGDKENRRVRDGEIVTACQQACPAEAIVFGDLRDPESKVSKLRGDPTAYRLLAELNTRPRTTYLAKIDHPHA